MARGRKRPRHEVKEPEAEPAKEQANGSSKKQELAGSRPKRRAKGSNEKQEVAKSRANSQRKGTSEEQKAADRDDKDTKRQAEGPSEKQEVAGEKSDELQAAPRRSSRLKKTVPDRVNVAESKRVTRKSKTGEQDQAKGQTKSKSREKQANKTENEVPGDDTPEGREVKGAAIDRRGGTSRNKSDPSAAKATGSPLIVFAHGAGAGAASEFMQRWKKLLLKGTGAVEVVTFDYPYLTGGKKGAPPKAEKLVDFHIQQIQDAKERHRDSPVILCGKSMGSRVGCMVAGSDDIEIAAVICLGYPLKGMSGQVRAETLLEMKAPVLFVQGSGDKMCPLDQLEGIMKKMHVDTHLHVVQGGDHSLKVGARALKEQGTTSAGVDQDILTAIVAFLEGTK